MVEARGGALRGEPGVDDSTIIRLEVTSVQSDGDGTVGVQVGSHGDLRGGSLRGGDAGVSRDGGSDVVLGVLVGEGNLALAGLSGVGVRSLRDNSSPLLDVLHSVPLEATVATLVANVLALDLGAVMRAVDEDLLGEDLLGLILHEDSRLEVTDGGESPAGAALSLVLDGGDLALLAPIPGSGRVALGEGLEVQSGTTSKQASSGETLRRLGSHLVGAGELLLRHVRELVHGEGGLRVSLAVSINTLEGAAKVVEANAVLLKRRSDHGERQDS